MHRRFGGTVALATVVAVATAACSSSSHSSSKSTPNSAQVVRAHQDVGSAQTAAYAAYGSVGQVYLTGAPKDAPLELLDSNDGIVEKATTDAQGSLIFRTVPVGSGYRVFSDSAKTITNAVAVTAWNQPPPQSFYASQHIGDGYGYVRMRDGIELSMTVHLPGPATKGPYPTVIEYSGYTPADPKSRQPSTLIAQNLGYATVGVNIRGTGCSGGAFQFFEPLQSTDGYDVVEAIAAQPWVANHKVGMVGISYPGITQLFVAQLQPPHLAAIAPLSVIDDTAKGTLAPGGILNPGFAVAWGKDRQHDAQPAPNGQPWANDRIKAGDKQCLANQALHSQAPSVIGEINANKYYTAAVADPLSPELFVHKINVPVYLAGAWQDEQTGGYFANLFDKFTGTKDAWFTAQNGSHTDSLDPTIFARWVQFLSIFVAQQVPHQDATTGLVSGVVAQQAFGVSAPLPPDPFKSVTSYATARRIFEEFPRIRILFENGAGAAAGAPLPRFEADLATWPPPHTSAMREYFASGGGLVANPPTTAASDSYVYDPALAQHTTITGGDSNVWSQLPNFDWPAAKAGTDVAYESPPLAHDVVVIGNASVDLWLQSSAPDTDLQATITDVRPDGNEMYVQNGWLRASARKLAPDATQFRPTHTFTQADAQNLQPNTWTEARVEMFPFAYVFHRGSRIRVIIEAPGGTRPRWTFSALPGNGSVNTVGLGGVHASSILLPVVPGVTVVGGQPPCPSLRGEPCRKAVVITNTLGSAS